MLFPMLSPKIAPTIPPAIDAKTSTGALITTPTWTHTAVDTAANNSLPASPVSCEVP